LVACDNDSTESSPPINIYVAAEPSAFTVGDAVLVKVTAENPTASSIEFGSGSSNCQLDAVIRIDNQDRLIPSLRPCLTDLVAHSLGPGEQRTEDWIWYGEILVDDELQPLQAGSYEILGVAGSYKSYPLTVEISE
jgi:hypothetical protein